MSRHMRQYGALLMAAALLLLPLAVYARDAASYQCEPAAGQTVLPGDAIAYSLTINQDGTSKEWSALRVKLGTGMTLLSDSIVVMPAAAEELEPAAIGSPEPEETASGNAAEVAEQSEYEIVPGNDGFVVLFSSIRAGDVISYSAKVDSEQADVSAQAQTEDFSISVSHTLGKLPQATPQPVQNAPVQANAQGTSVQTVRWTIALLCLVCLSLIGVLIYRRWGGALRRNQFLNGKLSAVKALLHRKEKAEATELTVSADAEAADAHEPEQNGKAQDDRENAHGSVQDITQKEE